MTRKQKITLSITGIVLVTLILVGLTYGYYLTTIKGNTSDKSITTSFANLELHYDDGNGNISATNLEPGSTIEKTFSVENTGNKKVVDYTVYLEKVINEFVDKNDLKITLKCESNQGTCNGNTLTYPSNDGIIAVNDIEVDEIQTFKLIVNFLETNDLQNDNMNKKFEGNVKILDIKSTNQKLVSNEGNDNVTVSSPQLLTNFKIYGNSLQETRSGKNLIKYPFTNTTKTENGVTFTDNGDGNITVSGTATDYSAFYLINKMDISDYQNKNLTFSLNATNNTNVVAQATIIGSDGTTVISNQSSSNNMTISVTEETKYLTIVLKRSVNQETNGIFKPQLELGSTATSYEKYGVSPSPEYPSEIKSVGDLVTDTSDTKYGKYKIPIKVTGKNLLNVNNVDVFNGYITQKKMVSYNATSSTTASIAIKCKPNTTYTISRKIIGKRFVVATSTKTPAVGIEMTNEIDNYNASNLTITSGANDNYLYVWFYNKQYDTEYTYSQLLNEIQIEEGDTVTDYEPYLETNTNIYLNEPLRKIGNYSDYIDLINKKVVRNIKLLELSENDNLVTTGISGSNYQGFALNSAQYNALKSDLEVYSNRFQYATEKKIIINSCSQTNATYGLRFAVSTDIVPNKSVNELKEYLKNNKTYIIYTLSASTEDTIEIPSIELAENIKHIFIESNIKPSKIEIGYIN